LCWPFAYARLSRLFVAITIIGTGGAISSAVARALGAGDVSETQALAAHAILLSLSFGVISAALPLFGVLIFGWGRSLDLG
jgi:Na+-driven multidrug efflux pump